jgi:hypothetical protein
MLLIIDTRHDITPFMLRNIATQIEDGITSGKLPEPWHIESKPEYKSDVKDFIRDTNKSIERLRYNLDLSRFIDDLESELEDLSDNLNLDND